MGLVTPPATPNRHDQIKRRRAESKLEKMRILFSAEKIKTSYNKVFSAFVGDLQFEEWVSKEHKELRIFRMEVEKNNELVLVPIVKGRGFLQVEHKLQVPNTSHTLLGFYGPVLRQCPCRYFLFTYCNSLLRVPKQVLARLATAHDMGKPHVEYVDLTQLFSFRVVAPTE